MPPEPESNAALRTAALVGLVSHVGSSGGSTGPGFTLACEGAATTTLTPAASTLIDPPGSDGSLRLPAVSGVALGPEPSNTATRQPRFAGVRLR